ncbi:hypothetical protein EXIGLDRAFT_702882 [Exidia glandulosa HHB12029]|uniref:SGNH hydrolase-type esterase domain-containing protein n=1 Tax=Exidia glandulosa HHB12029 TaxID=1314781 RepID=A0A165LDB3_EXIGL|nr:hypothetical protein EXIGLDRAFT_702882 [Exidia glandulosa HHB12029]
MRAPATGPHDFVIRSRAYEGLNTRVRRVLHDAAAGQPVKVGIIGGSVTFGQGVPRRNETWPEVFGAWWRERFPASALTLVNGAVPATGSGYWSMCFREHIDEDVDLVLTELAINDQRRDADAEWFEWLVRQLLELPKSPAVVHLQVFALSADFAALSVGGDLHMGVANYYDTPVISLRNALLPRIFATADSVNEYFSIDRFGKLDMKHINARGHKILADLLASHLERQLWISHPRVAEHDTIPPLRMFQQYGSPLPPRLQPYCASTRSQRTPLIPTVNDGRWKTWSHTAPGGSTKTYIVAKEPGAKVGFSVPIRDEGGLGRVRIQGLRSATFGLGIAKCWVDDDEYKAVRIDGYWTTKLNVASTWVVATNVAAGEHMLWCELTTHSNDPQHRTEFRIVAVDAA